MANGARGGGGGGGPTNDQLRIAQQMYAMMEQMKSSAEKISRSFESQAEATAKMAESMKDMGTGNVVTELSQVNKTLKEVVEAIKKLGTISVQVFTDVTGAAQDAAGAAGDLTTELQNAADATDDIDPSPLDDLGRAASRSSSSFSSFYDIGSFFSDRFPVAMGAATGALSGLTQSFGNLLSMSGSILGFLGSIASSITQIGFSILSLPLQMLGGLIEIANEASGGGGGGISEMAEAVNNLRKEFGALTDPTNTAVMTISSGMSKLSEYGINAYKIFGNMADRVKQLTELFTQGGAAIRSFAKEIADGNGIILAYQKGLGISNEEMGALASVAKRDGKPLKSVLNDITKQSQAMGKRFGLDAKVISREMAKAAADMSNFGHMSTKQLGAAVTYAQKLGFELSGIAGTLDQFSTFEDAAENVSTLNTAFGTNIDLNEIMQAQDQAEQSEIIRKAMLDQGITMDKLDFRQRKLLKSATGWDDAAANAQLSSDNMATSLQDIQKEGDKAEKTILSDAAAMNKLADAMERVFKDGGGGGADRPKNFWDAFTSGIKKAIFASQPMKNLLINLRKSTDKFAVAGFKIGQAFMKYFPGVEKMLNGLAKVFDPKLIESFLTPATKLFELFFKGELSFSGLMDGLRKQFSETFGGAGDEFLGGLSEMFERVKTIFAQVLEWVMTKLGEIVNDIADFLSDPPNVDIGGAAMKTLSPIAKAFQNGWKVLGPALEKLFDVIVKKLKDIVVPAFKDWARKNWKPIALVLFGPAALQALIGASIPLMIGAFSRIFMGAATGAAREGGGIFSKIANLFKKSPQSTPTPPPPPPRVSRGQVNDYQAMSDASNKISWGGVIKFLVGLAGVVAIGLTAYYVALKIVKGQKAEDIIAAGGVLAVIFMGMKSLVEVMEPFVMATRRMKGLQAGEIGKTLLTIVGIIGIGLLAMWATIKLVKTYNVKLSDLPVMLGVLVMGSALVAAAALAVPTIAGLGAVVKSQMANVLAGLGAIGLVIAAVLVTAWAILHLISKYPEVTPQALNAFSELLATIANTFMKVGVILGEATLIGAILLSTAGLGAAAMAAGFAAMAATVGAMAAGAMAIMAALNKLKIDNPDIFKLKVETFVLVFNAIVDGVDKIKGVMKELSGFTSFFSSQKENNEAIDKVTKFIKTLLEGSTGNGGLKALVDQMIKAATEIPQSAIEPAKAFAGLLSALASLIQSIGTVAVEFNTKTESFWDNIGPSAFYGIKPLAVAKKTETLTKFMDVMLPRMKELIVAIVNSLKGFNANPEALGAMGQAIGGIFTGVSGALKAMIPDGEKFKRDVGGSFGPKGPLKYLSSFGAEVKASEVDVKGMEAGMEFVKGVMEKLSQVLPPLIKSIGDELISIVNRIPADKIQGLTALGPILTAIAALATALVPKEQSVKMPPPGEFSIGTTNVTNITVAAPDMGKMLDDMKEHLPPLIDAIVSAAQRIPTTEAFDKQIKILIDIMNQLPEIAKLAQSINEGVGDNSGVFGAVSELLTGSKQDKFIGSIKTLAAFIGASMDGDCIPAIITSLELLENRLKKGGDVKKSTELFKSVLNDIKDLAGEFPKIEEVMDLIDDVNVDDILEKIQKSSPQIAAIAADFGNLYSDLVLIGNGLKLADQALIRGAQTDPAVLAANFQKILDNIEVFLTQDLEAKATGLRDKARAMQDIVGAGVVPSVQAVEDMIAAAQRLEESLNQGLKIDLDAKLKSFAQKFGKVGAKGAYTVQARDINLHVKFNVSMDAATIEKIMISNASSVIKNKVNLLIDAVQDSDAAKETATQLAQNKM